MTLFNFSYLYKSDFMQKIQSSIGLALPHILMIQLTFNGLSNMTAIISSEYAFWGVAPPDIQDVHMKIMPSVTHR